MPRWAGAARSCPSERVGARPIDQLQQSGGIGKEAGEDVWGVVDARGAARARQESDGDSNRTGTTTRRRSRIRSVPMSAPVAVPAVTASDQRPHHSPGRRGDGAARCVGPAVSGRPEGDDFVLSAAGYGQVSAVHSARCPRGVWSGDLLTRGHAVVGSHTSERPVDFPWGIVPDVEREDISEHLVSRLEVEARSVVGGHRDAAHRDRPRIGVDEL